MGKWRSRFPEYLLAIGTSDVISSFIVLCTNHNPAVVQVMWGFMGGGFILVIQAFVVLIVGLFQRQ